MVREPFLIFNFFQMNDTMNNDRNIIEESIGLFQRSIFPVTLVLRRLIPLPVKLRS